MTTAKSQEVIKVSTDNHRFAGLTSFFILTYALMLLSWGLLAILQMPVATSTNTSAPTSALAMVLYFFGGFTPSIAGFIMAYRLHGRAGLRDMWKRFTQFNLGGRWYLAMIGIPFLVQAGTALIFKMQGGDFVKPALLDQPASLIPLAIGIFVGGPLSEEFGWRGFAQDRVQERWGELKGSVILGLVWAFWHLPLFFAPGTGQQQTGNPALMFPVYAIYVVAMTLLITLAYNNTNRSIWGAIFFHFTLNFGAVVLITISEIADSFLYITNAGMMILLAVIVILFTRDKKNREAQSNTA